MGGKGNGVCIQDFSLGRDIAMRVNGCGQVDKVELFSRAWVQRRQKLNLIRRGLRFSLAGDKATKVEKNNVAFGRKNEGDV